MCAVCFVRSVLDMYRDWDVGMCCGFGAGRLLVVEEDVLNVAL